MLRAATFSSYGTDSIATMSSIDLTLRTAPVVLWIGFALIGALPRESEASTPRLALRTLARIPVRSGSSPRQPPRAIRGHVEDTARTPNAAFSAGAASTNLVTEAM